MSEEYGSGADDETHERDQETIGVALAFERVLELAGSSEGTERTDPPQGQTRLQESEQSMPGGLSIGRRTTPATRIKRMAKHPGYPRGVLPRKGYRRGSYHRGGIEAFQVNNEERRGLNIAPPETMTIPCVAMADTRSTFYPVDVQATPALPNGVIAGQYPTTQPQVRRCPTVATGAAGIGMEDTE